VRLTGSAWGASAHVKPPSCPGAARSVAVTRCSQQRQSDQSTFASHRCQPCQSEGASTRLRSSLLAATTTSAFSDSGLAGYCKRQPQRRYPPLETQTGHTQQPRGRTFRRRCRPRAGLRSGFRSACGGLAAECHRDVADSQAVQQAGQHRGGIAASSADRRAAACSWDCAWT
jgi:hypothetical protein